MNTVIHLTPQLLRSMLDDAYVAGGAWVEERITLPKPLDESPSYHKDRISYLDDEMGHVLYGDSYLDHRSTVDLLRDAGRQ